MDVTMACNLNINELQQTLVTLSVATMRLYGIFTNTCLKPFKHFKWHKISENMPRSFICSPCRKFLTPKLSWNVLLRYIIKALIDDKKLSTSRLNCLLVLIRVFTKSHFKVLHTSYRGKGIKVAVKSGPIGSYIAVCDSVNVISINSFNRIL